MRLNRNDRISYNNSVYTVTAVIWNTLYLQKTDDGSGYDYTMEEVQKYYHDIEFFKEEN